MNALADAQANTSNEMTLLTSPKQPPEAYSLSMEGIDAENQQVKSPPRQSR